MKLFIIIYCLFLFQFSGVAQDSTSSVASLKSEVIDHTFSDFHFVKNEKRAFLDLSSASFYQKVNPLTYVSAGLLFFYQRVLSEQISANCTYEVSCSEMTKRAIEEYGLIKGVLIGVNQLASCVPGNGHEHPKSLINANGKVINEL